MVNGRSALSPVQKERLDNAKSQIETLKAVIKLAPVKNAKTKIAENKVKALEEQVKLLSSL